MIHIIKLGGSLLDVPDLLSRLERFRAEHIKSGAQPVLLVGGGSAVDRIRHYDAEYGIDPTRAHWLAIRVMQANAHLLAAVIEDATLAVDAAEVEAKWQQGGLPIVDPLIWLEREANAGVHIPHCWEFTSDSIAAHLAHRLNAPRLTLLKSTLHDDPALHLSLAEAARCELVDACFPEAACGMEQVDLVNLRDPRQPAQRLRT